MLLEGSDGKFLGLGALLVAVGGDGGLVQVDAAWQPAAAVVAQVPSDGE